MDRKVFIEYWKAIEFSNKLLIGVVIVMAICMSIMAAAFYKYVGWQKVILVPPQLSKKVTIAGVNTSSDYVRSMIEMLAQKIMEYTPQDIQQRIDTVMFYVAPKYERTMRSQLDTLKIDIQQSGLSQMFRIVDMEVMSDGFAYISGNINRHVAGKPFWANEVKVRIQFTMEDGLFSLIDIKMLTGPFDYKGPDAIFRGFDDI